MQSVLVKVTAYRQRLPSMKSKVFCALLVIVGSQVFAARPEPQAQIDAFFSTLGDKGASAAIEGLCKGTLIQSRKGSELLALAPQFDAVLKIYGKIERTEKIEKKPFGDSFVRIRTISYHNLGGAPLFWEFMFFKAKDEWQIYVFRFNDEIDKPFSSI